MHLPRSLAMLALLPLLASCQSFFNRAPDAPSTAGLTRMQGALQGDNGRLFFQPCGDPRRYAVIDSNDTGVLQEASQLAGNRPVIYADLRGRFDASTNGGTDGQLRLHQLYRLDRSLAACKDPDFKLSSLSAGGESPRWQVRVTGQGMVVDREGQPPLALPYVEEQVGGGRFNLSTEANSQRIELWVAPQRCVDSRNNGVQFLSAELRVNGEVQRGCATFGGARNQ